MAAKSDPDHWKKSILSQLHHRNVVQTHRFQDLILLNNKLFEYANTLRTENLHLSIQNEKLKLGGSDASSISNTGTDSRLQEKIQAMEQKLLAQQEELTSLHRRKGENSQQIIDLNTKLQELGKLMALKDSSLQEMKSEKNTLETEVKMYQKALEELQNLIDTIRDELQASQLEFSALEEKLRKTQDENRQLVERLIKYKSKDADRMNEENDNFLKKRYVKMQKEIEDACRDTRGSPDEDLCAATPFVMSSCPSGAVLKFDAHDGEINSVKWSPVDKIVATGGADRKVKLWDISQGQYYNSRGTLVGSNAGVMSVDFDSTGSLILAGSNDFASRVWTVSDQRLRHTLTGHSGKVMAAKFLGEATKVVTGSHDRTLKIWDLRSRACTETKFAGSTCNDLVTVDSSGSTIISGHFDKSIRFWDTRSEASANNIILNGKITSLDLTKDGKYLLCCVRDDTLKLLDLRTGHTVSSFSSDDFKVGCDWARATFSPDGQYASVGSADGSVIVWNVSTAKVEVVLKEHTSAVTATGWQPYGTYLASVDKSKKIIIWGDK